MPDEAEPDQPGRRLPWYERRPVAGGTIAAVVITVAGLLSDPLIDDTWPTKASAVLGSSWVQAALLAIALGGAYFLGYTLGRRRRPYSGPLIALPTSGPPAASMAAPVDPDPQETRTSILHLVPEGYQRYANFSTGVACTLRWMATAVRDDQVVIARIDWRRPNSAQGGNDTWFRVADLAGDADSSPPRTIRRSFPRRLEVNIMIAAPIPSDAFVVSIVVTDARERKEVREVTIGPIPTFPPMA